MSRSLFTAAFLLASGFWLLAPARAQDANDKFEAAKARMLAKEAERKAAAAKPVTITAGELEAMQSKLHLLEAENADLRGKLAAAASGPTTKPARVVSRKFDAVEVGMTQAELMTFMKSSAHGREYQAIGEGPDNFHPGATLFSYAYGTWETPTRSNGFLVAKGAEVFVRAGYLDVSVKDGAVISLSRRAFR